MSTLVPQMPAASPPACLLERGAAAWRALKAAQVPGISAVFGIISLSIVVMTSGSERAEEDLRSKTLVTLLLREAFCTLTRASCDLKALHARMINRLTNFDTIVETAGTRAAYPHAVPAHNNVFSTNAGASVRKRRPYPAPETGNKRSGSALPIQDDTQLRRPS